MQLWHTFNYFQTRIHKWIFSTSTIRGQYVFGWIGLFLLVLFFSRHKVTKTILFLTNRRNNNEYDRDFLRYFCRRTTRIYRCRPTLSVHLDWCHYRSNCKSNISSRDKIISILILFAGTLFAGGVFEGLGQSFSTKGIIFGLLAAVSFSFYVFASGRVATDVPPYTKSFLMTTSATLIVCLFFPPTFLTDGALQAGLWKYAFFLGLFGVVVPVICFQSVYQRLEQGLVQY